MPACEKCWSDSRLASLTESSAVDETAYGRLVREPSGRVCTPEQQAGPDATRCEKCDRMTRHQHCRVCMACGDDPARDAKEK